MIKFQEEEEEEEEEERVGVMVGETAWLGSCGMYGTAVSGLLDSPVGLGWYG